MHAHTYTNQYIHVYICRCAHKYIHIHVEEDPTTEPKLVSTATTSLAFESANSRISKGTETNGASADATLITIVIIITVGVVVGIIAVFILVIICVKVLRKKNKSVIPESLSHAAPVAGPQTRQGIARHAHTRARACTLTH